MCDGFSGDCPGTDSKDKKKHNEMEELKALAAALTKRVAELEQEK